MSRVQITFRELLPDEALCAYARRELAEIAHHDELATCRAVVHRVELPGRGLALVHATVGLFASGRELTADAVAASALDAFRIALETARRRLAGEQSAPRARRVRTASSRLLRHRLHAW